MTRRTDAILAASAPAVWGSTYIVTSELLPPGYPLTDAALRALPAGLLLMAVTRSLPPLAWLGRLAILGALNFAIFWAALFVAAYRLPGGVAATMGAVQPLIVLGLSHLVLGSPLTLRGIGAALAGIGGVALLVLGPRADLDPLGMMAALVGAVSMAGGVVLTRKWRPEVPALTFTAWQLTAGGVLLTPLALALEPALPLPSLANLAGFLWLGFVGAALSYFFWFRGIERLGPSAVTGFGFLSPLTAVLLGWALLGERLGPVQMLGAAVVLSCVWIGSRGGRVRAPAARPTAG
ncbi:EamA family transporter [Pseudoroseicyclus aestuarii]|uniref:Putative blue pigment (Indigoidine) exporter n=1 Tax=Pseudoroseicyclus aestuarii TaxID=1795041 RepID=A0A318SSU8_9RHOB|nr:EamA family transporter [Pseudoroseicyclus aestuarii]PYE84783.1 putative blue pigment (indigoidine) exporter [Pseudoroseicyclus aestuarii]